MTDPKYDLLVIGAGPGGYIGAIRAAQLGMRVVCVDKDSNTGGTCLNVGCIPSKALLDSSERFATLTAGTGLASHGIRVSGVELDLDAMMERKRAVVSELTQGIAGLFKKNGVEFINGQAELAGAQSVRITRDGKTNEITATRILIASGSVSIELPGLPFDGKRVVSSTEALSFTSVPKKLLVVGAGAIGLELGSVWRRLGSEVTVVELTQQIVPGADPDAARALQTALKKQGIVFRLATIAKDCQPASDAADSVDVTLEKQGETKVDRFDCVLVAVGRRAASETLGTKRAGVETDDRGRINVDENFQTSVPSIYAVGDVIGGPMLAHKAEDEAVAAVERMNGIAGHVNYAAIPSVVYTQPELASVGLTEPQAKEKGFEVAIGKFSFRANARARCSDHVDGLAKIVTDAKTDRVLGVHIVGHGASELISEGVQAIEYSATAEDIARTVHAHPTLAEALKEAALAVAGRTLNA